MAGRKSRPGKKSQKRHSGGQDITILLLKENVRDRIGAVEHEMHEIRRDQPREHEQRGRQKESMPGHQSNLINHVMDVEANAPTGQRRRRRRRTYTQKQLCAYWEGGGERDVTEESR